MGIKLVLGYIVVWFLFDIECYVISREYKKIIWDCVAFRGFLGVYIIFYFCFRVRFKSFVGVASLCVYFYDLFE